jgi:toxin ParE1/3/4
MAHRLSPLAEADIEDLAYSLFLQTGSLDTAYRLIELIAERFILLGIHPRAGRRRDDLRQGTRVFPVGEYLVLYRIDGQSVVVQRVVRGSRDLASLPIE